jgi:pimeloyl-ACP methyl ester carboxylesterase
MPTAFQAVFRRRRICLSVLLVALSVSVGCSRKSANRWNTGSPEPGQTCVFLLLGFGDLDGSEGMDKLAATLKSKGCFADLEPYRKWKAVAQVILRDRPDKLVLIGHSHGGVVAIKMAHQLKEQGVSVQLLVLLDVGRPDPIPANVDKAVHYYVVPRTLSFRSGPRSKLEPGNRHTKLTHIAVGREGELAGTQDVDHMNICESAVIQRLIAERL